MITQTSLNAYRDLQTEGLGRRQVEVLRQYKRGSYTDLELSQVLGWPINCITGRRNELIEMELVREKGIRKNPTGKNAIVWGLY